MEQTLDQKINEAVACAHEAKGKPHLAAIRRLAPDDARRALIHLAATHREEVLEAIDYVTAEPK